jgi:WD40 repeat protein
MEGKVFRRLHYFSTTSVIHCVHSQTMTIMDDVIDVNSSGWHREAQLLMHSSTQVLRDQSSDPTTFAGVGKNSVGALDGKNSCDYIPPIPTSLIVEHILPYLDRDTYDNFIVVSKEILDASKMVTAPPWPEKCIEIGTGIYAVAFSPTGRRIVCGCEDGSVRLLDSNGRFEILSGQHKMAVISVAFSPNEMFLVSSSRDFSICVWQLTDAAITCTQILKGQETPVHSISFFPCGNVFAACGCDNSVRLWNASNGKCIATIPHRGILESIAISQDGSLLASAMWDGFIQVFQVSADFTIDEGKTVGRGLPSTRVEFSEDERYLYGYRGFRIRRWDISNWNCDILAGHREERVCSVSLSPNAKVVAYGERDGAIQLSTVAHSMCDATLKATMRGHRRKCDFAFSPNGKTLASGSVDGSLRLWEIYCGRLNKQCDIIRNRESRIDPSIARQQHLEDVSNHIPIG